MIYYDGLKEIVIVIVVLCHKDILQYYDKIKYSGIKRELEKVKQKITIIYHIYL